MRLLTAVVALAFVLVACTNGTSSEPTTGTTAAPDPSTTSRPSTAPEDQTELPGRLGLVTSDWETDFSKTSIDLSELRVGIPASDPRDLIPPIDEPAHETIEEAGRWLEETEPGVLVEVDDLTRFYPLRILTRHEIVNDDFAGTPVVVTYCPLCNTALAFDPVVDGEPLRFGVSGLLRNSDLVMWDDRTQSLWQQITGEAIVGELTGTRLDPIGSAIVRWADFADTHPNGEVLSQDTGFGIAYGANPYVGYSSSQRPFLFDGEIDERFPALERVVGVTVGDVDKAYPFSLLSEQPVANDVIDGVPVAVLWGAPDTADALDASRVAEGRGVGTGVAYFAEVEGETLTFAPAGDDLFVDDQTGTTWTLLGEAVDGPLGGAQLEIAPHRNEFWFAWQAFFPEAEVWQG